MPNPDEIQNKDHPVLDPISEISSNPQPEFHRKNMDELVEEEKKTDLEPTINPIGTEQFTKNLEFSPARGWRMRRNERKS